MKQSLQLKMGQQLTMTPQLQQAIRLLQLSSMDLQQEIQEALENNPLLEVEGNDDSISQDAEQIREQRDDSQLEASDMMKREDLPNDLPVDSSWDDTFSAGSSNTSSAGSSSFGDDEFSYQGETSESLQDYLTWQMQLSHFSEEDELIAAAIIEAIDEAGYLTVPLEDILESVSKSVDIDAADIGMEEICMVLKRVQQFDPIGVGARDVAECLLLQLKAFPADTPWLTQACTTLKEHMPLLASRDYRTLARKLKVQESQLREVLRLIHALNPRPGDTVIKQSTDYVIPDVTVVKKNGRWIVELNPESVPKLKVNEEYAAMSRQAKSP
ncbi:RNA polymerase factor sigma-54, partial [Thalassospira xiamenensis]